MPVSRKRKVLSISALGFAGVLATIAALLLFTFDSDASIAHLGAGLAIPWHPAASIAIFVAFGAAIPFIYQYGYKGKDPQEAIDKIQNIFKRGQPRPTSRSEKEKPSRPSPTFRDESGTFIESYRVRFFNFRRNNH